MAGQFGQNVNKAEKPSPLYARWLKPSKFKSQHLSLSHRRLSPASLSLSELLYREGARASLSHENLKVETSSPVFFYSFMKIEREIKFYSDSMLYKQDYEKMTYRNVETNWNCFLVHLWVDQAMDFG